MSEHTLEEHKAMKTFLNDVEQRLDRRQSLFHNRIDWRPEYGTQEAWNAANDAEHAHLIEQWNMLRALRKEWGIKQR